MIKIEDGEEFNNVINILKFSHFNLKVFIINKTEVNLEFADKKAFSNLTDLSENHIAQILNSKISLQGRVIKKLGELVDEDMYKFVKVGDVLRIIQNDKAYVIGDKFDPLPSYFIERSLFKIILSSKALYKVKDDIFIILNSESCSRIFLSMLKTSNLSNVFLKEFSKDQFKGEPKNIHWLNYKDVDELEWLASSGSVSNINSYLIEEKNHLHSNLPKITKLNGEGNVRLITATSGMGCSLLLQAIAFNCLDAWCINVKNNSLELQDNLSSSNCFNIDLSRAILKKMKLVLLVDDFYPTPQSIAFFRMQSQKGITSYILCEPILKETLMEAFGTFAFVLPPFSIHDQKNFLLKYYRSLSSNRSFLEDFAMLLLQLVQEIIKDENFKFASFPLRLKMLADIFKPQLKSCITKGAILLDETAHFLYFYREYLKARWEKICLKFPTFLNIPVDVYSLLALKPFFTKNELKSLRINEKLKEFNLEELASKGFFKVEGNGEINARFEHESFAEYFCAFWIYENIDSELGKNLYRARFRSPGSQKNLYKFLDMMLAKGKTLHLLLINCRMNEVKIHIVNEMNSVLECDEYGRSFFHIAALYGVCHEETPDDEVIEVHDELVEIIRDNFVDELAASPEWILDYSPLEYAVGSGTLAVANLICELLPNECINTVVPKSYIFVCVKYCSTCVGYASFCPIFLRYLLTMLAYKRNILIYTPTDVLEEYVEEDFMLYFPTSLFQLDAKTFTELLEKLHLKHPSKHFYNNLRLASVFGNKENLKELLRRGARINSVGNYAVSPLHYAVFHEKLDNVDFLLQEGADVNILDIQGKTCLHIVAERRNPNINLFMKLLLWGADINLSNNKGDLPIHVAIEEGHAALVDLLLPRGLHDFHFLGLSSKLRLSNLELFDVNKRGNCGHSLLLLSLKKDALDVVDALLKQGADCNIVDDDGDTCLHYAIAGGYKSLVAELILKGADVNIRNNDGNTPIIVACGSSQLEMAQELLKICSRESVENTAGYSALQWAIVHGHMDLVAHLFDKGAEVNSSERSPLMLAVGEWNVEAVLFLLEKGADCNSLDQNGKSCLHYAIEKGHFNIVAHLLNKGVDINQRSSEGDTPILFASQYKNINVLRLLIKNGANIFDSNEKDGSTCLHYAAAKGFVEFVLLFLELGLDLDAQNGEDNSPLHCTFKSSAQVVCTKLLMAKGADINLVNRDDYTTLHYAALHWNVPLILELVNRGVDIAKKNKENKTALELFMNSYKTDKSSAKILLCHKSNVNAFDYRSWTCLHWASRNGEDQNVLKLLSMGANVNMNVNNNETPLFLAIGGSHLSTVKLLLKQGADANIENTCLHEAVKNNQIAIMRELIKNGVKVNARNIRNETPLFRAIQNSLRSAVDLLLSYNADVNIAEIEKRKTCLILATEKEEWTIAEELLKKGADVNVEDETGNSPLFNAAYNYNLQLVDTLKERGAIFNKTNLNECLHRACTDGHLRFVQRFLEEGAEINAQNSLGETPLLISLKEGDVELTNFLLQNGADFTIKTNSRDSCLHYSAAKGNTCFVEYFLKRGVEIDCLNIQEKTPLFVALEGDVGHIVLLLLDKGADVFKVTQQSFLHKIIGHDLFHLLDTFLDKGLDIDRKDRYGFTPLMQAIDDQKIAVAWILLERGADVNAVNNSGSTSLHFAADKGFEDLVLELIKRGALIDKKNFFGDTPLLGALQQGYTVVADILLDYGADPFVKDGRNSYAMHYAITKGCYEALEVVLKRGFDVDKRDDSGCTPLDLALSHRSAKSCKLLLGYGADVNLLSEGRTTCLYSAVSFQFEEVVEILLGRNVDVYKFDWDKKTPLRTAVSRAYINITKLLLAHNVDPNFVDNHGCTYLHYAARIGDLRIVLDFINRGFDFDKQDDKGRTPMMNALNRGHFKVAKVLIEMGAKTNTFISRTYKTCIHILAERGEHELLDFVIKKGTCNVNLIMTSGQTGLMVAAENGRTETVKLLLSKGADPNILDENGYNCLHHAAENGAANIVHLLVTVCDINLQTYSNGRSPLLLALWKKHAWTAKVLLENGADCCVTNYKGCTALHEAVKLGSMELVNAALNQGCSVNDTNKKRRTPLFLALKYKKMEIARLLVEMGGDVFLADSHGDTCLHKAVESGDENIVVDLIKTVFNQKKTKIQTTLHKLTSFFRRNSLKDEFFVDKRRYKDYCTPLHVAFNLKSRNVVQLLLSFGANPTLKNLDEYNALHYAAELGYDDLIPVLLEKGCGVNEKSSKEQSTPLTLALKQNKITTAKLLLELGADPHSYSFDDTNPLFLACSVGNCDLVKYFIKEGVEIKIRCLTIAVKNKHIATVALLFESGCDVVLKNSQCTSFHHAVRSGFVDIVQEFIERGADLNAPNHDELTPLHLALSVGHSSTVKLLLSKGADVTYADKLKPLFSECYSNRGNIVEELINQGAKINGNVTVDATALLLALKNTREDVAEVLLKHGADFQRRDSSGNSCLHYASMAGFESIVRLLIEKGAKINTRNGHGKSPLLKALKYKRASIARILLENGALPTAVDYHGFSCLHFASRMGGDDIVGKLINLGLDVNLQNKYNKTPLMLALSEKNESTAALLLSSKKIKISLKEFDGTSYLHYASKAGFESIVEILISQGIDLNTQNDNGDTPLSAALKAKQSSVGKLLISKGVDLMVENSKDASYLHLAIHTNDEELVRLLINKGIDVNIRNDEGNPPIALAFRYGNQKIIDLLLSEEATLEMENQNGYNLLHYAVRTCNVQTLEILLRKLKFDTYSNDGSTPLSLAILYKNMDVARFLLKKMIALGSNTEKCLQFACEIGDFDVITELMKENPDLNKANDEGDTSLALALKNVNPEVAKLLIASDANVFTINDKGYSCLHYAAAAGQDDLALQLINKGVDCNSKCNDGNTPLLLAIQYLKTSTALLLVSKGADVNMKNNRRSSALHYAARTGAADVLLALLEKGANLDELNDKDCTPLAFAVLNKQISCAKLLLQSGASATMKYEANNGILHYAAKNGLYEILLQLLPHQKPFLNDRNESKQTPLQYAIKNNMFFNKADVDRQICSIKLLLQNGANVFHSDLKEKTAFHYYEKYKKGTYGTDLQKQMQMYFFEQVLAILLN